MVGLRKIEIWRMKPVPYKVAAVGEELFDMFNRLRREQAPNDLGTDWFGRMLAALFKNDPANSNPTFTVLNTAGTSVSPTVKRALNQGLFNDTSPADCGAYIGVGTSTISPAKQDTALRAEVVRSPASANYTDGGAGVTVSTSFTLASTTNISEVGLYWKRGSPGDSWLLDRTVLTTPVTFPANTAMLVAYVFAV